MKIIDLRSDTVTKPTKAMLEAMFKAEVGDDVFEEDPCINKLEAEIADRFGKEAALFCPSGTMTNQIALSAHCKAGDELICDETAHVYQYEGGGIAANARASVKFIHGDSGIFDAQAVENCIQPDDPHKPLSRMVVIENTSNRGGGTIWPAAEIEEIRSKCDDHGLMLHLDGARLFNALVESEYDEKFIGDHFDSISICLSKGLGAPVGSVLLGDKKFIKQSRRIRKRMGGGMRQAGYLAEAARFALKHHVNRLKDDHQRAEKLKHLLEEASFVESCWPVYTNIVVAKLKNGLSPQKALDKLLEQNIKAVPFGPDLIRMVTHLNFNDADLDEVASRMKQIKI